MNQGAAAWPRALSLLACGALVAIHLLGGLGLEAWDDAYFFKRVGVNILDHGVAAWNLEHGPIYGNTSQGFQLVALLALLVAPAYYFTTIKILSAALYALFFVLLIRHAREHAADASERARVDALALLGTSIPFIPLLLHSGMEVFVTLVVLALSLHAIRGCDMRWPSILAVAASTAVVYAVRPDAALMPFVAMTVYHGAAGRRIPWQPVLASGLAVASLVALFYLYFGTPVPLSFYLKSQALSSYSESIVQLSLPLKHRNAASLALVLLPLLYIAAHGRSWWGLALLLSGFSFLLYHFVSTIEIMGYQARFYVPGLVPLVLAALVALPRFRQTARPLVSIGFLVLYVALAVIAYRARWVWVDRDALLVRVPVALSMAYLVAAGVLILGIRARGWLVLVATAGVLLAGTWRAVPVPRVALASDQVLIDRNIERYTTVRGIRALRECIAEPFHMYHSEIGIPGVVFQRSTITDLVGIMDAEIALRGLRFDERCERDRPEVVFLPHRNYKELRDEIARSRCMRGYTRVVADSSSPLFLRNDLVTSFRACARQVGDRWVVPR